MVGVELSGWVLVALVLIVLGYLVPHLVRGREVLVDSRVEDRFSPNLRLVDPEVARPSGHAGVNRVLVHPSETAQRRTEALAMIRPTAPVAQRANARQLASARATRAAEISRRAAAGRRRTLIVVLLAGLTVGVWAAVVAGPVAWGWGLLPTALLGAVGYLAARMFVSDRAADAKARSEMARLESRLRLFRTKEAAAPAPVRRRPSFDEIVTGGGAHAEPVQLADEKPRHARPGVLPDEEIEEVEAEPLEGGRIVGAHRAPVEVPAEAGATWTPVPVPVPTYTMKVEVPRRTISPYDDEVLGEEQYVDSPARPSHSAPPFLDADAVEEEAQTFDLNDVLARRRAAGA